MRPALRHSLFVAALIALGWLGWRALRSEVNPVSAVTEATLWTRGAGSRAVEARGIRLALGDAVDAPASVPRIPDAAFLRRAYPALRHVTILGDGVDAADAVALAGLPLAWQRGSSPSARPELSALSVPPTLRIGERLAVQGRVRGIAPEGSITLSLENPDGTTQSTELKASAQGESAFSVTGQPAVAAGRFEWKLRVGARAEPLELGVAVVAPEFPRTLILEASPNVEAARLQRWLAEAGAPVTSRTRVSEERMRFAAANGAPPELADLGASTWEKFDVVVLSQAALLELSAAERTALEEAIKQHGLGVVITGEPASADTASFFQAWQFAAEAKADVTDPDQRVVRLRLGDGTEIDEPVAAPMAAILRAPLQRELARDPQGHVLASAQPRGTGWIARTLVTDTWKWLQAGHPEAFAAYWSHVLSQISRPRQTAAGRGTVLDADRPRFVGEPVRLQWPETSNAPQVYWPAQPGWQVIRENTSGAMAAVHVHARDQLRELRAEERRRVTARAVAAAPNQAAETPIVGREQARSGLSAIIFIAFVISAGLLWLGERRAGT